MPLYEIITKGCGLLEIDECDCECHEPGSFAVHNVPCCSPCSRCKRHVRIGWMENHKANCPANKKVE